jgi:uncharacterized membrane protein YcaP (DUF421 family)
MESVIRAASVYLFVLAVFRITGKRSLSQITTFDFVVLLIIGEATQQALLGDDFSVTNAWVVIATLMSLEIVLSWIQAKVPAVGRAVDSVPLVLVEHGKVLHDLARREGVTAADILAAGRERHGLERLDQIKFAILERHGGISIIPVKEPRQRSGTEVGGP